MQKKTVLSACIAFALSGQGWAADTTDIDGSSGERKNSRVMCPAKPGKLNTQELKKRPSECTATENNKLYPWFAVGATALVTTLAAIELSHGEGHHSHSSDPQPTPPDDNGGNPPAPPSDDGSLTPVAPDDGGDTPVPPDDGGDTPIPPDDGDDTPDKHDPVVYKNDVTWDQDAKTLKLRDTTFTYTQNDDGSYTLTGPGGITTIVNDWLVDEAENTASFNGVNPSGTSTWRYDEAGKIEIIIESLTTADGTTAEQFNINDATITDHGGNIALNGGVVINVDGNDITLNNDGQTTAIGEGSVVGILTGDDITITNNGETDVDGGTAVIVNGDRTTLNTVVMLKSPMVARGV